MPRYVVLLHQMPSGSNRPTHFDLMLEDGEVLRTWELTAWPPLADSPDLDSANSATPSHSRELLARQLPDHRPAYLTYEGEISGGRGHVQRRAAGQFAWLRDEPNRIEVGLETGAGRAVLVLERPEPSVGGDRRADQLAADQWIVNWKPELRNATAGLPSSGAVRPAR